MRRIFLKEGLAPEQKDYDTDVRGSIKAESCFYKDAHRNRFSGKSGRLEPPVTKSLPKKGFPQFT